MSPSPVVVSLPIADRRTSCRFYTEALELEPFGEPASDGVPEPLQFALNDGVTLMLIPSGGFGCVIADHDVAPRGQSECLLSFAVEGEAAVRATIDRAQAAGATIVQPPERKPWAFFGTFADPDGHLWMVEDATSIGA